jgi:inorganic triphosphatase YgiF
MSEIELKFGVPEGAMADIASRLRQLGARTQAIESHYWDSPDRRLAKGGLSLRLRKAGGRWEQTLKAPGASPVERHEETVSRPGRWEAGGPAPEPWMFAGSPAGEWLDRVLVADKKPAVLERVHASLLTRRAVHVEIGGAEIEIALDRGAIAAGSRSLALCELEAELKHGDVSGLIAFARASVDVYGLWLSTITKAARGSRLAAGNAGTRAVKARPPALEHVKSGEETFRAVLRSCLDQVLANASVLAEGDVDDEVVHQLRIGIRRLRTAWRELGAWSGPLDAGWEAPAAEVFRALGDYRDRRTVAATMHERLLAAGSPEPTLGAAAKSPPPDPVLSVRSPSFQHALLDLLAFLMEEATPISTAAARDAGRDEREHVISVHLHKLHARLARDARRFAQLAEIERHRARKRLKRLRYLSELVAPLYRPGRVRNFLERLEPAQDELGRYMDIVVAINLATEMAEGGEPRAWFNVGWLKAQMPEAVKHCGGALDRVASAKPFWSAKRG